MFEMSGRPSEYFSHRYLYTSTLTVTVLPSGLRTEVYKVFLAQRTNMSPSLNKGLGIHNLPEGRPCYTSPLKSGFLLMLSHQLEG